MLRLRQSLTRSFSSRFNQILSGIFFSAAGFFVGGELGMLTGAAAASSTVSRDPESKARIETAFRKFRIDMLRKETDYLENGSPLSTRKGQLQ